MSDNSAMRMLNELLQNSKASSSKRRPKNDGKQILEDVMMRILLDRPDDFDDVVSFIGTLNPPEDYLTTSSDGIPPLSGQHHGVTFVMKPKIVNTTDKTFELQFYKIDGVEKVPVANYPYKCCYACTVAATLLGMYDHHLVLQSIASGGVTAQPNPKSPWATNG